MERYKLQDCFLTLTSFYQDVQDKMTEDFAPMLMDIDESDMENTLSFIVSAVYGYFYDDLIAYPQSSASDTGTFLKRLSYDIAVKFPYWFKKYNQIRELLTTDDLSLLQTSKVVSSSRDNTASASGSLQKIATTPTGVTAGGTIDNIDITNTIDSNKDSSAEVETTGFADKYSNTQQKFASANNVKGERSGTITREGSIDDLLNVLEKLPSSFANEVTKAVGKHFIFDYDGEERGYYDETD